MTELYRDQLNWNLWWWDLVLVYFYICFSVGSNVHQVEDNCWVRPISEKWTHLTLLMEKEMATHSSTLAWKIPWTEEPGRLQSMRSWRVGHDWAASLSLFTFHFHALEKEMVTHSSVLAWRIPGTGEPGGLLSMGLHRVRHDWSDLAAAAAPGLRPS